MTVEKSIACLTGYIILGIISYFLWEGIEHDNNTKGDNHGGEK